MISMMLIKIDYHGHVTDEYIFQRYVDHTLTAYLNRLTHLKTFNNKDIQTYKQ